MPPEADVSDSQLDLDTRLYLVRDVLLDVLTTADDSPPYSRMRVILTLDHAIDLLLHTILPELDVSVDRGWVRHTLVEKLFEVKPSLRSHGMPVERLHQLRNRVQHDGITPSQEDVRSMKVQAEAFIRDTVREVKTIELEEVTLNRYVSHEGVRTHLQNAEQALAQDNYPDAVTESAIDFCVAEVYIDGRGVTRNRNSARHTSRDVRDFATRFQQEMSRLQLSNAIEGITKPIEIMYFGIQLSEYDRFKTVTPHIFWGLNTSEPRVTGLPDQWAPPREDAAFAVDFAIDSALRMQRRATRSQ